MPTLDSQLEIAKESERLVPSPLRAWTAGSMNLAALPDSFSACLKAEIA